MQYALLVALILSLTACDTVPTHPNDDVHKLHGMMIEKHKAEIPSTQVDSNPPYFTEEKYQDEDVLVYQIADEVMTTVDRTSGKGAKKASRDAHPKENGCVEAEFHAYSGLDHDLAKGVFAKGQTYRGLVRFSNSSENPAGDDHDADARGMAIKLTHELKTLNGQTEAVPLPEEQDFVMINHNVFILDDPTDYLSLVRAQNSSNTLTKLIKIPFALGFRGMWNAFHTIFQDEDVLNPLVTQYFSMVPYRLGTKSDPQRRAIKFSAKPYPLSAQRFPDVESSCAVITTTEPPKEDPNYLRTALRNTLAQGDACMEFMIQVGTKDMSVENSQIPWEESESAFHPAALIKISKQQVGEWKDSACEDKSFNPWHAGEAHRPLGVVNRLRKVIYPIVSNYRHCVNYPDDSGCQVN